MREANSITGDKTTRGWRARLAERRADRRQMRAWRRARRKGAHEPDGVEPLASAKYPGGSGGPAGNQQNGGYPGF